MDSDVHIYPVLDQQHEHIRAALIPLFLPGLVHAPHTDIMAAALAVEPVAHGLTALATFIVRVIPPRPLVHLRAFPNDREDRQLLFRDTFHLVLIFSDLIIFLLLLLRWGRPLLCFPRALPATVATAVSGRRANLLRPLLTAGRLRKDIFNMMRR